LFFFIFDLHFRKRLLRRLALLGYLRRPPHGRRSYGEGKQEQGRAATICALERDEVIA
jgi:hypothetical protein